MGALPSDRVYWSKLRNRIALQLGDQQNSEDLLHSAIVRLLDSDAIVNGPDPAGVLMRTAKNLEIDRWRKQKRQLRNEPMFRHRCERQIHPDPLKTLEDRTTLRGALRLIDGLSPLRREIFFMRHLDDLSVKDIATHFGVTVSAIEKQLIFARAALARWIHEQNANDRLSGDEWMARV
jgi:RNA polymerase sigma factor (sigma-70 family)